MRSSARLQKTKCSTPSETWSSRDGLADQRLGGGAPTDLGVALQEHITTQGTALEGDEMAAGTWRLLALRWWSTVWKEVRRGLNNERQG